MTARGLDPCDGTADQRARTAHRGTAVAAFVLAAATATALGIARTLVHNGTGYLTVGGRVLDTEESLGLLGLPGTTLPGIAGALLLASTHPGRDRIRPTVSIVRGIGVLLTVAGQFLPAVLGARSSGADASPAAAMRCIPLNVGLVLTLAGLGLTVVASAAGVARDRDLVVPIAASVSIAAIVSLGLRSAGAAFRWRLGPPPGVELGLWMALGGALAVAGLAATWWARRLVPPVAVAAATSALVVGAVLLSR